MSFAQVFLSKRDAKTLFKEFDSSNDGNVSYEEFLKSLAPELEGRRLAIVQKVFALMDKDGSGSIDINDVIKIYSTSAHPDVQQGKRSKEDVVTEFLGGFESRNEKDGIITEREFISYYKELSVSIPSDEYFVTMMESVWMIHEDESSLNNKRLDDLCQLLKEKVYQKCKGSQNSEYLLRNVFKFFDKDESGVLTIDEFKGAMERFGLVMDRADTGLIFSKFDKNNDGIIKFDEFLQHLYA